MQQLNREKVLVVDDEPESTHLCERILRNHYEVLSANSGAEALEKAQGQEIVVALVDQRMPNMTGLEFLIQFLTTHPYTGRVVITAYTQLEDIVRLINQGRITGFVVKPWDNHHLLQTVRYETERYRRDRTIESLLQKVQYEHREMYEVLRSFDPDFQVPNSNNELKCVKKRLRNKVTREVERMFVDRILKESEGNKAAAARATNISRTLLHKLLRDSMVGMEEDEKPDK